MHAVIVSFRFLAPKRPCPKLVQAHQQLLDRLPGVESSVALDSRAELAFLLTYSEQAALDAYFESEEFHRLSTQPGCNDVFVKAFNIMPVATETAVDTLQSEAFAREAQAVAEPG